MSKEIFLLVDIIVAVFITTLGFTVYTKSANTLINRIFFQTTILIGLWIIANYFGTNPGYGHTTGQIANSLSFALPILCIVSLIRFITDLTQKKINFMARIVNYLALPTFLLSLSPLLISNVVAKDRTYVIEFGPGLVIFGLYILSAISYLIWLFLEAKKLQDEQLKKQLRVLSISFMASIVLLMLLNFVLPAFFGLFALTQIGIFSLLIMIWGLIYTITKHRLFDIRMFVIRAVAYTLTTIMLGLVYIAPLILISFTLTNTPFSRWKFISITLLMTLAAASYSHLRGNFDKQTNRVFFREMYNPTELIGDINRALITTLNLKDLVSNSIKIIETHIKPEYCIFILKKTTGDGVRIVGTDNKAAVDFDGELDQLIKLLNHRQEGVVVTDQLDGSQAELRDIMQAYNIAAVSRMVSKRGNDIDWLGYIVLSPRKSGLAYSLQDMQVFEAIANTMVLAIQNALHFEEIQQFNLILQERVEDATRKLRATNDKLKKLDETKDEFISMASHQMRTPLTSVKGYLSMVLDGDVGKLNKQQEELLKQSFLSSQRMVNLISDLLNLSRLNTGKFVIDATSVDLRDVVEQELMQLREVAKSRDIALDYTRPESFPVLQIDENKMHQVVMNFIDNAVYYTPNGGTVSVSLVETPTTIEYRVKDTGIGVPREVQRHLFTKFYRAENAKRARPDGTGLGLFMAKKVIVAQGGAVIFESEEGKGSTFGFRFSKAVLASEQGVEAAAAAKLGTKK
jgi:signal transduction histidine kinase